MSFKYLNPGFPGLLDTTSGVLVEDEKCSRTGVGFWQPNTEKGVKFPTYPQELYCKFDFFLYYDTSSNTDYSIIVRTNYPYCGISLKKSKAYVDFEYHVRSYDYTIAYGNETAKLQDEGNLRLNQVNTVCFHYKPSTSSSSNDSVIEIFVNGKRKVRSSRYAEFPSSSEGVTMAFSSSNAIAPLSSILLSDEPFDMRESLVRVPVKSVTTDMTDNGDGTYTTSEVGQTLLQELDVPALLEAHGATSDVTGILSVASPACRTEALNQLTHVEKQGDTVTEYGSTEVGLDATGAACAVRPVSMKLSELAGLSVGWKAGSK